MLLFAGVNTKTQQHETGVFLSKSVALGVPLDLVFPVCLLPPTEMPHDDTKLPCIKDAAAFASLIVCLLPTLGNPIQLSKII